MDKSMLLPVVLALLAVVVIGYGTGVLPSGLVSADVPSHDAAQVTDNAGKSIDANLNGIIDKADSCLVCGGAPAGGGGGGPPAAGGTLVDIKVIVARRLMLFATTLPNADVRGITFPYAVPGNPSTSQFIIEGCWGGYDYDWYALAGTTDLTIDWVNRRIVGYSSRIPPGSSGGYVDPYVSRWNIINAQSNTNYASIQVHPSGSSYCGYGGGCPVVNVDFASKTINSLPAGCNFETATLASFT